jgi:hypothetical protein
LELKVMLEVVLLADLADAVSGCQLGDSRRDSSVFEVVQPLGDVSSPRGEVFPFLLVRRTS